MLIRNCVGGIMPFYFVIFLLLASVMSSVHCLAQWSANPALNNAICTAVDNQSNPTITSDGNGGTIITWLDFRGGTFYDIYAQRIDAGGVIRWTSDGVAICTAVGDQSSQTIIPDGIGGAIITWRDDRIVNGLYAQRINGAGVTQWASDGVQICTGTIRNPMTISDGIGGAIITWQDFRSGNVDIYAQRINAGGIVQWTSNGLAICTATNIQRYPTITSDGSSGAIIVWEDARDGINNHIYAQGINASGTVKWTNDGIAICTAPTENFDPTIISDGSAGAIITWYTNLFVTPTDGNDIYAQRINASGVVQWVANGVAICKATADQSQPVIISDGSAGAIISWGDQRSGTYDVYAQRINAGGTVQWTTDGAAICTATNSQSFPTIASDGSAGAIISWYDFRSGANFDIYAQRINASGGLQWTTDGVAVSTAGGDQTFGNESTSIISNSNAESIITWRDARSGSGYDIYAQRVNANGSITISSPTITTFTPASGPIGTTVTITGTNFSTTPTDNTLRFNGTLATVTASSATSITTTVPAGASTGTITVTVAGNTATSGSNFIVTVLSILSFTPASGPIGTTVNITGTNFNATPINNTVRFNGILATVTASSSTSITTTVPSGASSGTITVTVAGNTATSGSNFTVTTPSITITTQPSDYSTCAGGLATFTTVASGTTNITYQWQFAAASTGPYNNIMNGSEYSNVTASTLSVNTTGNFGAGNYRCKISGDFVPDKYSNAVTLMVNDLPVTPSITSEAACGPASFSITASGAINGQYRWYTTAVGGTSITGETNSSYTTPVINSSEAYYVAIYNGICESARNGVVAQVNMVPAAPTVVSTTACSPSSVTLQASEGGESQYRWYTQALGGPFISGETGSSYVTPSLSTPTTYYVTIVYLTCESARTAILADVRLCSANLPPSIIPASTVAQIDEKVTLNLAVLISDPDNNLDLSTLKIITQPESKASASIDANHNLIIDYKGIAFTGRDRLKIEACDLANSCTQQEIIVDVEGDILVYNAISPNGDGKNDTWVIKNIDLLKDTRSNHVIIFNRWGDSVFEVDNYDNANRKFTGLNKNGIELPTGTYFYKMEFASGRKSQTGFISLKR